MKNKTIIWIGFPVIIILSVYVGIRKAKEPPEDNYEYVESTNDTKLSSVRTMFVRYKEDIRDTVKIGEDSLVVFRVAVDTIINGEHKKKGRPY